MGEWIRFGCCALLTLCGLIVLLSGLVGQFRFRDSLSRIHAAALYDTLGVLLMLGGLMVAEGFDLSTLKMAVTVVLLWLASPVSSHLIARMEVTGDPELERHVHIRCPEAARREREDA